MEVRTGPLTIGELLRDASAQLRVSGSETARLDTELLLGHVLRVDRATLLASPEAVVSSDQAAVFHELVARREKGEPVAYIRGMKEFYGLVLTVDARALIPRPETELLVDLALDRLRSLLTERARPAGHEPLLVWDVGTGSGAIAVAVASECRRRGYGRDVRIRGTDISGDALALAVENAVGHGVADIIDFARADLTGLIDSTGLVEADAINFADAQPARQADLLLANLPYVPSHVVPTLAVAASFEPPLALDGGPDGLVPIKRLLGELQSALDPAGIALLEIGDSQAAGVCTTVASVLPGWELTIHDDLAGLPRVAELRPPAPQ